MKIDERFEDVAPLKALTGALTTGPRSTLSAFESADSVDEVQSLERTSRQIPRRLLVCYAGIFLDPAEHGPSKVAPCRAGRTAK